MVEHLRRNGTDYVSRGTNYRRTFDSVENPSIPQRITSCVNLVNRAVQPKWTRSLSQFATRNPFDNVVDNLDQHHAVKLTIWRCRSTPAYNRQRCDTT